MYLFIFNNTIIIYIYIFITLSFSAIRMLKYILYLFNLLVEKIKVEENHEPRPDLLYVRSPEKHNKKRLNSMLELKNKTYGWRKMGCSGVHALWMKLREMKRFQYEQNSLY